ncbi:HAD superfamily hydrolase (TIGR01549 family) [Microbacterium sp. W4I4]|uniref:HAD family hydrolase n=1 Tax=Microbacterium sp. W4I4 TaxID=3042295 RepID=UPI0027894C94|nr:HAD family hydrolase [Microbacterium sp. W4I4]MDQ0613359.1 HAD superfamily hydrolase (TIGR01549 family) [Microbacterium sp. W4I4]
MGALAVFDLDGTLVDQVSAVRTWAREFADDRGLDEAAVPGLVAALIARTPKDRVFAQIVDDHAGTEDPIELWASYRRRMPELVAPFAGVPRALTALRAAGWTLGIATNGMADNQEGKIRRTGLDGLIDGWVVSSVAGVRKPDPRILHMLADRLGCPLYGWMVGDGLESDIACGVRAGMRTAWISEDSAAPASARPDLIVPSVAAFADHVLGDV